MKTPAQWPWKKLRVGLAVAVVGWMVFVYMADLPYRESNWYLCRTCRASKRVDTFFLIRMPARVREWEFTRYYRKLVDPDHQHLWSSNGSERVSRKSDRVGDCYHHVLDLSYYPSVAILEALPDHQTRQAFLQQIIAAEDRRRMSPEQWLRVNRAVRSLDGAYFQNPNRRDWVKLVKKVGLYPKGK